MRFKQVNSEIYGKYYSIEIGMIDFKKMNTYELFTHWNNNYHPSIYFSAYGIEETDKNSPFSNFLIRVPLLNKNKNWKTENEEVIKNNIYLKKQKTLPIAITQDELLIWHMNSVRYFSDEWISENIDYVNEMKECILELNMSLVMACKCALIKEIRKSLRLGADVHFKYEDKTPLEHLAIATSDEKMIKYLAKKSLII